MEFKDQLKELRLKKGLTQKELAELAQIPLTTIQKYERGVFKPKIENLTKLANVLDTEILQKNNLYLGRNINSVNNTKAAEILNFLYDYLSKTNEDTSDIDTVINELHSVIEKESSKKIIKKFYSS